jgi:CopA family copper-resistance protein
MRTRRDLLRTAATLSAAGFAQHLLPSWARGASSAASTGLTTLAGNDFDLEVTREPITIDGRRTHAIAVNGNVPAPLLRWQEGDEVTLRVTNHLRDQDTSIHWHGLLLPNAMDGVPGLTYAGIQPGETFTYRFPVKQAGTYWYHSHSGLQEQLGHLGPIIIDPQGTDPVAYDREYVVVLSDWTFGDPHRLFAKLKKMGSSLNFQRRTVGDFFSDETPLKDREMWGRMRMSPTDISDVTAAAYTYLVNGQSSTDNWTALFEPGQRVRLRVINASAMTVFNVRIPGLPMTVVQSDGLNVQPVETDEFRIGVAETYDVVVQPERAEAFTLMCETSDCSGFVRATLAPRAGMAAAVPPRRPRPLLTMKDMGMAHDGMEHAAMGHTMPMQPDPHAGHDMSAMGDAPSTPQRHDHPAGFGVANLVMKPSNRLAEAGTGLDDAPHRVLTYSALRSLDPRRDERPPEREIEVHLTGNMERYMWSFDGEKFSDGIAPIVLHKGERVRMTLVNDTMMAHPIHLHGMFFDVVGGPRKHTILVKPAEKVSVDVTADALGEWAFHCHLMYHMHAGMFRVVSVREGAHPMHHHPEQS